MRRVEDYFDDLDAEARAEAEEIARYEKVSSCAHWNCVVAEWWFSGTPREMLCLDCGKTNQIEEDQPCN